MTCRRRLKVGEHPDPIATLTHNVNFATDEEINTRIERKYRLYEWLTPNDYANTMMLQSVIDQWAAYCDKIYATTLYDYDPIVNYDRHEEGKEITGRHKGSKRSIATDVTQTETPRVERVTENSGYGFDSGVDGSPVGKTTEVAPTGTDTTQTTGNAANNYETVQDIDATHFDKDELEFVDRRTWGNIGTTKTQELIQAQRDITIDVLDMYVAKFGECFDLSRDILYGWLSNEDEPDWEYPEEEG